MPDQVQIVAQDVRKAQVRIESGSGRQRVIGLPILRPGVWNGKTYTVADLRLMVENFALVRDRDNFVPGVWPMHNYSQDGASIPQPAANILGLFSELRFDASSQTLLGDIDVLSDSLTADLAAGKLRYPSVEVFPNYLSAAAGRTIGPVLVGVAFVSHPAATGMPWAVTVHSACGCGAVGADGRCPGRRAGGILCRDCATPTLAEKVKRMHDSIYPPRVER